MASNKVNLGIGLATGMFYTATAGTALPSYPGDSTGLSGWTEVGAATADGITWSTGKDSDPIRNWAKEIERLVASDEGGTVQAPLMYTEKKTLETIFGASNVSDLTVKNGLIYIDSEEAQSYTFKQDYYFMMGDNRHNSLDSRYWGFVPEDHIVGKPAVIWLSIDGNKRFPNNIRWRRFFKFV